MADENTKLLTIEEIAEFLEREDYERVDGRICFPSSYDIGNAAELAARVGVEIVPLGTRGNGSQKPRIYPLNPHFPYNHSIYCKSAESFRELIERFKEVGQLPPYHISASKNHSGHVSFEFVASEKCGETERVVYRQE